MSFYESHLDRQSCFVRFSICVFAFLSKMKTTFFLLLINLQTLQINWWLAICGSGGTSLQQQVR